MTPEVEEGQLRFVLSWPFAPKDLDIHSFFKISKFSKCEVYFGKRECVGVNLDTDNFLGGKKGVETITIERMGNYIYTFAVHKYIDISGGVATGDNPVPGSEVDNQFINNEDGNSTVLPNTPLSDSNAKISVYVHGFKAAIVTLIVPNKFQAQTDDMNFDTNNYNWWTALCLNGKVGIDSLKVLNKLTINKPSYLDCENAYAKPSFIQKKSTILKKKILNQLTKRN